MLPLTNEKLAKMVAFIEKLSKLPTPTDPKKLEEYAVNNPIATYGMCADELEEEVMAEYPGDDAYEDAVTFFKLIKEARAFMGVS